MMTRADVDLGRTWGANTRRKLALRPDNNIHSGMLTFAIAPGGARGAATWGTRSI